MGKLGGFDLAQLATVHKALGDVQRLRILHHLPNANGDVAPRRCNVNALAGELRIPQTTLSHHLKILRQARIVGCTKISNRAYYFLDMEYLNRAWRKLRQGILRNSRANDGASTMKRAARNA